MRISFFERQLGVTSRIQKSKQTANLRPLIKLIASVKLIFLITNAYESHSSCLKNEFANVIIFPFDLIFVIAWPPEKLAALTAWSSFLLKAYAALQ